MNTIRMTSEQYTRLRSYLLGDVRESAAFLLSGFFKTRGGVHFTVRDIMIPDEKDYDNRSEFHIQVSPIFFNRAIGRAEGNGITVVACHSHPFSENNLSYSPSDNHGESISSKTIHDCLGEKPMGSLLFGPNAVIGRAWIAPGKPVQIDQLRIIGRRMDMRSIGRTRNSRFEVDAEMYDRQIRAFGAGGQELISRLNVGIVGLGGTGSSVAEQLAREGVRRYALVDHDRFEPSNKTRLYGSYAAHKNEKKVDIVKRNIQKITPGAEVLVIPKTVIAQEVMNALKDCDVVFSCSDKHAPRSVLNELSYQYYIPVIDVGVGLDANNGRIDGGAVRATLIAPGLPCLYCSGIINSDQVLAESLSKEDRYERQKQGYVKGMNDDEPSVITFTTMAATFGLMLLKDMLFGFVDSKATTVTLDIKSFHASRLSASVRPECVCSLRSGKGDYMPLSAP